jgi:hypothetical protein
VKTRRRRDAPAPSGPHVLQHLLNDVLDHLIAHLSHGKLLKLAIVN